MQKPGKKTPARIRLQLAVCRYLVHKYAAVCTRIRIRIRIYALESTRLVRTPSDLACSCYETKLGVSGQMAYTEVMAKCLKCRRLCACKRCVDLPGFGRHKLPRLRTTLDMRQVCSPQDQQGLVHGDVSGMAVSASKLHASRAYKFSGRTWTMCGIGMT